MKKTILSILALIMVMGIFTGCGASTSSASVPANSITVSEMLNSIIEESGEVKIYTHHGTRDDVTKDYMPTGYTMERLGGCIYTGDSYYPFLGAYAGGLGMLITDENDTFRNYCKSDVMGADVDNPYFVWETDEDNNVTLQRLVCSESREDAQVHFGNDFSRIEIEGVSCMVFRDFEYEGNSDNVKSVWVTVIKDTDYTKDKVVVLDPVDSIK